MIVGWYTYTCNNNNNKLIVYIQVGPARLFVLFYFILFFFEFRQMKKKKKKTNTISACEWHAPEDGSRKWLEFRPLTPPLQVQDNCAQELLLLLLKQFATHFFFGTETTTNQMKNASGWIFHSLFSKNQKNVPHSMASFWPGGWWWRGIRNKATTNAVEIITHELSSSFESQRLPRGFTFWLLLQLLKSGKILKRKKERKKEENKNALGRCQVKDDAPVYAFCGGWSGFGQKRPKNEKNPFEKGKIWKSSKNKKKNKVRNSRPFFSLYVRT